MVSHNRALNGQETALPKWYTAKLGRLSWQTKRVARMRLEGGLPEAPPSFSFLKTAISANGGSDVKMT
jgi:hypothetical protein